VRKDQTGRQAPDWGQLLEESVIPGASPYPALGEQLGIQRVAHRAVECTVGT